MIQQAINFLNLLNLMSSNNRLVKKSYTLEVKGKSMGQWCNILDMAWIKLFWNYILSKCLHNCYEKKLYKPIYVRNI